MTETMQAGRELDALIAEKVIGWRHEADDEENARARRGIVDVLGVTHFRDVKGLVRNPAIPAYSTNIAAAWQVVEKMHDDVIVCSRREGVRGFFACFARPSTPVHSNVVMFWARGSSYAHAICLAALGSVNALSVLRNGDSDG